MLLFEGLLKAQLSLNGIPWMSLCCVVLSLITNILHFVISPWLLLHRLMGFHRTHTVSEPEGPIFFVDLTRVRFLWWLR
jgi:hypothetical protein